MPPRRARPTHPGWNVALQLANGVGSPSLALEAFSRRARRGIAVDGASWSAGQSRHPVSGYDWTKWHFIELGLTNITKGSISPGSRVQLYIDGARIFDDTNWRADTRSGGLGGLIPARTDSIFPKFGVYGGNTRVPWPRDHYFAKFKIGTTRASIAP